MSKQTVIAALLVAVALGLAVILTTPRATTGTPGGPSKSPGEPSGSFLVFDPARVTGVEVVTPARKDVLERRGTTGEWWLAASEGGTAWPVNPGAVRALLRMLATIERAEPAQGELSASATALTLRFEDGKAIQLRISDQALGGRVILEAVGNPSQRVWVTSELHDSLAGGGKNGGVRAWRDVAMFPGIATEATRIRIDAPPAADGSASSSLLLARVQGKWAIVEPIATRADPQAIASLLSALASMKVSQFADGGGAPAASGGSARSTGLRVVVESDAREVVGDNVRSTVTTRVLGVGAPVGLSADRLSARLDHGVRSREANGEGPVSTAWVELDAKQLDGVVADPAAYVAKTALSVPAADVGAVEFASATSGQKMRVLRDVDGWKREGADAGVERVGASDAAALNGLLKLLAETPMDSVMLHGQAKLSPTTESVTLYSIAGDPVGSWMWNFSAGVGAPQPGAPAKAGTEDPVLLLGEGAMIRLYSSEPAVVAGQWLDAFTRGLGASKKEGANGASKSTKSGKGR